MSGNGDSQQSAIRSLALVGRAGGEVRRLEAFDKKRHTVPDRVCGATQAFLEKLCEPELEEAAEELFRSVRAAFGYKRKELSLSVGAGFARMEARDFVLEMRYELDEEDASFYVVETQVKDVASRDLLESDAFGDAVGRRFDRLRCGLSSGVSVEAVIDAVEEDETGETSVDYPSDCAWCTVQVEGVAGEVFFDGAVLEVRYGRMATAGELMVAFERIGERFFRTAGLESLLR